MERNLYDNNRITTNDKGQRVITQVIRNPVRTQYIKGDNYNDQFGSRNLTPPATYTNQQNYERYDKPHYNHTQQNIYQNRTQYIRPNTSNNMTPDRTQQQDNYKRTPNAKDGIYQYLLSDGKNYTQTQQITQEQKKPVEFTGNNYVANTPVGTSGDINIGKEIGNYVLTKLIGKGQFGKVYLGKRKSDQKEFAVKVILKKSVSTPKRLALFKTEVGIMQQFDHPNIMKMEDFLESSNNYYQVMLQCNNSDMTNYLKKRGIEYFKENEALHYLKQIALAFRELHKKQVMHRDFKIENLFVHDDRVIIGDFGMSKAAAALTKTQCGTGYYMAPEVQDGRSYTNKADLWGIGITFYEMLFGKVPFEARSPEHLKQVIKKKSGENMNFPNYINSISDSCKSLIRGLLTENPSKRIQWSEFFTHEVFLQNDGQKDANSSRNIDYSGLKHSKEINESFIKAAKDVNNDEIVLKDPMNYMKENANNAKINPRINNVEELKTDQATMKKLSEKQLLDDIFNQYVERYLHERNKCHLMIKAVKNLRSFYKQIAPHKNLSDIALTYILLIKKALAFEEMHIKHLKRYTNIYNLKNFIEFLKTNRYKELIEIYSNEISNLERTFNQLVNVDEDLVFSTQELALIDSLCGEGIDVKTVDNWLNRKIHVLKTLIEDPKIQSDSIAEKQLLLALCYTYYSIECDKVLIYKEDMKFSFANFNKKIESSSVDTLVAFVCSNIQ